MSRRRTNAILAIAIIMVVLPVCTQATPPVMPHGVAGTVYLSDGVTQAPAGTSYNITTSEDYKEGTTGTLSSGRYAEPINGTDGDPVTVYAWNATHYGLNTTTLSPDAITTLDVIINIPSYPVEPQLCTNPDPPSHNFGSVPEGQTRTWTFEITNCGGGQLDWTVSDDQPWITVNPTSGSATTVTDTATVTIDTTGLTAGATHTVTVTVSSNDGTKTGTISVSIPPSQEDPLLCTNPDPPSHDFGSVQQGETRTWTFDITNCGEGTLTWTVSDDQSWITVSPASGSTTTETDTVTVTIDTTGLASGATHDGTITVGSNDGTKTGTISVYVETSPPPTPAPTPINYEPVPAITPPGILSLIALLSCP